MALASRSAHIERIERGDLACWQIRSADGAELLIAEQGAQVLSYTPAGGRPLIWLSEDAAFTRGQSVRGGVPVCWPWFGDLARNPAEVQAMRQADTPPPAHGEVRARDWQLLNIADEDDGVSIEFILDAAEDGLPGWPHALELKLAVRLDARLSINLVTTNLGREPVAFSQALHSYFAVGDIHQVSVEGLEGRRYIETLANWQERRQQGALRFTGETDRIYLDLPPTLSIVDPAWQRRIVLQASGSDSAVLWNPWIDKAARLSQFADDAWQRMLCIETANVMDDCIILAPEATHEMGVSIRAEAL